MTTIEDVKELEERNDIIKNNILKILGLKITEKFLIKYLNYIGNLYNEDHYKDLSILHIILDINRNTVYISYLFIDDQKGITIPLDAIINLDKYIEIDIRIKMDKATEKNIELAEIYNLITEN